MEPSPEADIRDRQQQAFGGAIQWEAAFFGWLAAIGLAAILVAMAIGARIAVGLTDFDENPGERARELGLAGAAVLVFILALSYCAGGYVAGRMARFDGWRQGLGVWLVALGMTVALGLFAWAVGGDVNPLESLELPRVPVDEEGSFPLGSALVTAAIAIVTLGAAIVGGRAGERFHRAVDEAGADSSWDEVAEDPGATEVAPVQGPAVPDAAAEPNGE